MPLTIVWVRLVQKRVVEAVVCDTVTLNITLSHGMLATRLRQMSHEPASRVEAREEMFQDSKRHFFLSLS